MSSSSLFGGEIRGIYIGSACKDTASAAFFFDGRAGVPAPALSSSAGTEPFGAAAAGDGMPNDRQEAGPRGMAAGPNMPGIRTLIYGRADT